jgi:Immunity protein 42
MPVVGEPTRFAVEYDLNENYGGVWMFGRFCYWCGGQRVGDYEMSTPLRDVLLQLDEIAKYNDRASRRFSTMSASLVLRLLDATLFEAALFGGSDPNNSRVAEEEQWARHKIVPWVDVFDRWKAFLVEDERTARFIFASKPYLDVREISLRPSEVDAVLDVVRNTLNGIYERESNGRESDD